MSSKGKGPNYGTTAITGGGLILALIIYCLFNSDPNCVLTFGRFGFIQKCDAEKNAGYIHTALWGLIALVFIIGGLQVLLKKNISLNIPGTSLKK